MEQKTEASQAVDERAEFEKTMSNLGQATSYQGDGWYAFSSVRLAWDAWQARAALKAQPAPADPMELLRKLVQSNVGQNTKWKLSDGIGTDTDEGRAWAAAIALVEGQTAPTEAQGDVLAGYTKWMHDSSKYPHSDDMRHPFDAFTAGATWAAQGEDSARLEFLMQREAWIAWSKDGESCRVFHRDEDGDAGPIMGWVPEAWSHDPREAIDRARASAETGGVK